MKKYTTILDKNYETSFFFYKNCAPPPHSRLTNWHGVISLEGAILPLCYVDAEDSLVLPGFLPLLLFVYCQYYLFKIVDSGDIVVRTFALQPGPDPDRVISYVKGFRNSVLRFLFCHLTYTLCL